MTVLLRLCDILTVKTVKRIRPIRGSALVHIRLMTNHLGIASFLITMITHNRPRLNICDK